MLHVKLNDYSRKYALDLALAHSSSRIAPPRTPWTSIAIHGLVFAVWGLLFARAFYLEGMLAWSVGMAYVGYDTLLLAFVAWQARALRWPARHEVEHSVLKPRSLAVIVAAHNEAAALPITLHSLFGQTRPPDEIVIADDGSTDGTAALLMSRYGLVQPEEGEISAPSPRYPTLRWLRLPHGGKACALNAALVELRSETFMTVDADTLLDADACDAMTRAFARSSRLAAATGLLTPVCARTAGGRFFEWFQRYEYIRNFVSRFAWARADGLLLVSGAFACYRRDAVVEVGGFDPKCLVEDYELIHRLRRHAAMRERDWDVQVVGEARATTDAPGTLRAFLRQRRRWFAGFLQTQYWYREMTGNRRYGKLGLMMLPVKAFDTMQPIYGVTAFGLLLAFLIDGQFTIALSALGVIGGKIAIDLAFHAWSIHLYRRWSGDTHRTGVLRALLASILEPFTFQLMRHGGAAIGWFHFFGHLLGRRQTWGVQQRTGIVQGNVDGSGR